VKVVEPGVTMDKPVAALLAITCFCHHCDRRHLAPHSSRFAAGDVIRSEAHNSRLGD